MVTAPCILPAFPFLWEDKAAGVTFSLGKHSLTKMKFLSFFSLLQIFHDPYCVLQWRLQITQTFLSTRTTSVAQMNFWPKVFPNSQFVRSKGRTLQWKTPRLGTLWIGTRWSSVWGYRAALLLNQCDSACSFASCQWWGIETRESDSQNS